MSQVCGLFSTFFFVVIKSINFLLKLILFRNVLNERSYDTITFYPTFVYMALTEQGWEQNTCFSKKLFKALRLNLLLYRTDLIQCECFCAAEKLKAHVLRPTELALVKLRIPVSERIQDHQECIILRHYPEKDAKTLTSPQFLGKDLKHLLIWLWYKKIFLHDTSCLALHLHVTFTCNYYLDISSLTLKYFLVLLLFK